jgi:hypothetical protein
MNALALLALKFLQSGHFQVNVDGLSAMHETKIDWSLLGEA